MKHFAQTWLPALACVLLLGGTSADAQEYRVGALRISNAWIPATSEGKPFAPGYMTITNTGSSPDVLVSGSIVGATQFSIQSAGGGSSSAVQIGPGQSVTFQPGGPYLVFSGLSYSYEPGMQVQSMLKFQNAGSTVLSFTVQGAPATTAATGKKGARPHRQAAPAQ